ncbi:integrase core domain contained protein [Zunongwangia atlantica 22II14-10F7]|uniref:Integrase core domain contained protein n=1 Tax=Zunongwangia atlantica 22II14-10F7 TaxID=1185767 RepID=A0A1Y1SZ35_9FLAO|nr:integrase core domain contained protein [Zunongwangia atlantica 22II14-10F7]
MQRELQKIRMDNGSEFAVKIASAWRQMQGIIFQYIQTGSRQKCIY